MSFIPIAGRQMVDVDESELAEASVSGMIVRVTCRAESATSAVRRAAMDRGAFAVVVRREQKVVASPSESVAAPDQWGVVEALVRESGAAPATVSRALSLLSEWRGG